MDLDRLIDGLAEELGVPPVTRRKWRQRRVPYRLRDEIRELAANRGVTIPREAFDVFGRNPTHQSTESAA